MARLIIPTSTALHDREPQYACTLCEAVFTVDEKSAYERHVLRAHDLAELQEHSLKAQAPGLFDPMWEGGDVDWQRWIDRHRETDPHGWRRWMKTGLDK